ncbi:MAG: S24 family peptidase [Thiotrichales bacterium]|nr:S24 family peptidase [Thiotrichales bacterium]MCY4350168.1 S24 family peptidase [Thiotrichales bacterium]
MSDSRPVAGAAPPTTCIEAEPFALRVTDDSMEPEFAPGCIIIVDPTGVAKDGAFVLAEIDGAYLFRRLERTTEGDRLVALKDGYAPVALATGLEPVRGVVVQRAGARRRDHKRYD